jgi:hypothetical protein
MRLQRVRLFVSRVAGVDLVREKKKYCCLADPSAASGVLAPSNTLSHCVFALPGTKDHKNCLRPVQMQISAISGGGASGSG